LRDDAELLKQRQVVFEMPVVGDPAAVGESRRDRRVEVARIAGIPDGSRWIRPAIFLPGKY
jgi:hypothetical protein